MSMILNGTHVGYSGSKRGMTDNQHNRLRDILATIEQTHERPIWLHHGDCVGGDQQAHVIARLLHFKIYLHPPDTITHRAFCDWDQRDLAADYMSRNSDIARWSKWGLIAAPKEPTEQARSGTWSTIRRAVMLNHRVLIIPPRGREFRYVP